jgi:hypothetical protein
MERTLAEAKEALIDFLIPKATMELRKDLNDRIKPYGKNYIVALDGGKYYFTDYDAYANAYVFEETIPKDEAEDDDMILWSVGKKRDSLIEEILIELSGQKKFLKI